MSTQEPIRRNKWVTLLEGEDPPIIEINQGPMGLSLTRDQAEEVMYELQDTIFGLVMLKAAAYAKTIEE
jgi:hypothetical protein